MLDGEDFFKAALFVLSKIEASKDYYRFSKRFVKREALAHAAISLLANCLSFFSATEKLKQLSVNEIKKIFKVPDPMTMTLAAEMILRISYYQAGTATDNFGADICDAINFLAQTDYSRIIGFLDKILAIANNMAFFSDNFAVHLPGGTDLFSIKFNEFWKETTLSNYFKLLNTIFRRLAIFDKNEESWQRAISAIQTNIESIYQTSVIIINSTTFSVKKSAIEMLCGLVRMRDNCIVSSLFSIDPNFLEYLTNFLLCQKACVIKEVAKTVLILIDQSPINGSIDIINLLLKCDLESIIGEINADLADVPDIALLVDRIQAIISTSNEKSGEDG